MNVTIKSAAVVASGATRRVRPALRPAIGRRIRDRGGSDAGMTTAEYAVGTLGACALAAGLYKVATSTAVLEALAGALDRALHAT
ncbi:hypothetical protein GCM10009639_23980 [Kitasatospora putterlickiae]|uniref:DUF4244 domain-containing protein n=1 Tax=Kitasatospora putterlickiae TaxID=221725 RepID=A0ABN1XXF2_9ACTN